MPRLLSGSASQRGVCRVMSGRELGWWEGIVGRWVDGVSETHVLASEGKGCSDAETVLLTVWDRIDKGVVASHPMNQ